MITNMWAPDYQHNTDFILYKYILLVFYTIPVLFLHFYISNYILPKSHWNLTWFECMLSIDSHNLKNNTEVIMLNKSI